MTLTSPITISKLKTTFGTSYNKIGQICAYANINMWSKYKPFRSSSLCFASISSRDSALAAANQGLAMGSTYSTPAACLAAAKSLGSGGSSWTYLRPRGLSSNEWYRLLDFDGYNHSAEAPMQFSFPYTSYAKQDSINVVEETSAGMSKGDFSGLSSYNYLGLVIQKSGGTAMAVSWLYSASTKTINAAIDDGSYDCAFFISNTNLGSTWGSASQSGSYILIPFPYKTLQISGAAFTLYGDGVSASSSSYGFTLHITSSRARSLTGLVIRYRKTGNYTYNASTGNYTLGSLASGEQDITIGTLSNITSYSRLMGFSGIDNPTSPLDYGKFFSEYAYNGYAYIKELAIEQSVIE